MKNKFPLSEELEFLSEYACYLLGCGVHTSRVFRNTHRIGEALGVEVKLHTFQKNMTVSIRDNETREFMTNIVSIPPLPISFTRNVEMSALSWEAIDYNLSLDEIRHRFEKLKRKKLISRWFVLVAVSFANLSFCRIFGGDWIAALVVLGATFVGFYLRQILTKQHVNHFFVFFVSAFVDSLIATLAIPLKSNTADIAIATSPLFLIPGVPLINGVIDIIEGYVLIGISRLVNAFLLIVCLSIGMACTLMIVNDSLL